MEACTEKASEPLTVIIDSPKGEDLPLKRYQQTPHILPAYTEAPSIYASDHLEAWLFPGHAISADFGKVNNTSELIPCGAIIVGDFGFYHYFGTELIWHHKVGGLIETGYPLCTFRPAMADSSVREQIFHSALHDIPDEFRDAVTVAGERSAQIALIE